MFFQLVLKQFWMLVYFQMKGNEKNKIFFSFFSLPTLLLLPLHLAQKNVGMWSRFLSLNFSTCFMIWQHEHTRTHTQTYLLTHTYTYEIIQITVFHATKERGRWGFSVKIKDQISLIKIHLLPAFFSEHLLNKCLSCMCRIWSVSHFHHILVASLQKQITLITSNSWNDYHYLTKN